MTVDRNYFRIVLRRLKTLGVKPKDSRVIALDLSNQVEARGVYNALDYFKRVGDTLIGYVSKSGYKAEYVKTTYGYPTRWLCLKAYPVEIQLRVAKMARVLYLDLPTSKMVSKLHNAIVQPSTAALAGVQEAIRLQSLGLSLSSMSTPSLNLKYKSVFSSARTYVSRSVPNGTKVELDTDAIFGCLGSWIDDIVDLPGWQDVVYPVHPYAAIRESRKILNDHFHVGQLGGVMEQGGKLRLFAAPNIVLQNLLEPLQLWLDDLRLQLPWDVFKSQNDPNVLAWVQEVMQSGRNVQSVDLTSATCRFPFEIQVALLEELLEKLVMPKEQKLALIKLINFYKKIARGKWKCQPHLVENFGTFVSWVVGQPLGVNPSMSSFALSHGLVIRGLCEELHLDPSVSFMILGDDVVFANKELELRYRQVIASLGVEISEHKSYDSPLYGEFAGYSFTPTLAVRPGRWRPSSVLNIQGLVDSLGAAAILELPESEHLLEELIAFDRGVDVTKDPDRWYKLMKLNSLLKTSDPFAFKQRDINVPWVEGACSFLHARYPSLFFTHSLGEDLMEKLAPLWDLLPDDGSRGCAQVAYSFFGNESFGISNVFTLLESRAQSVLSYTDLISFIDKCRQQYEDFLWSVPKTDASKQRSARKELSLALAALDPL